VRQAPLISGRRLVMIVFHWVLLVTVMMLAFLIGLFIQSGQVLQEEVYQPDRGEAEVTSSS
jgi:hypothetical protein